MERWWGKRYDRNALMRLYGDLRAPVLEATVKRGLPHEQAAALAVLGQRQVKTAEALIAGQLTHEYPLVRYFARRALERLGGKNIPLDVEQPLPALRAAGGEPLAPRHPGGRARPPRAPSPNGDDD
jgi:hypothetical protein